MLATDRLSWSFGKRRNYRSIAVQARMRGGTGPRLKAGVTIGGRRRCRSSARRCAGPSLPRLLSSCPDLFRASTSLSAMPQVVDARNKSGHDGGGKRDERRVSRPPTPTAPPAHAAVSSPTCSAASPPSPRSAPPSAACGSRSSPGTSRLRPPPSTPRRSAPRTPPAPPPPAARPSSAPRRRRRFSGSARPRRRAHDLRQGEPAPWLAMAKPL